MESVSLHADIRSQVGSGASHQDREKNLLPGILYGKNKISRPLVVDQKEFIQVIRQQGMHALVQLALEEGMQYCMIKEVQKDPVSGSLIHVDFEVVNLNQKLRTHVPILLVGAEYAEKQGVLQRQLSEVTIEAMPDQVPKFVQGNVAQLNVGESIKIRDLEIAEEISILSDLEGIVATLTYVRNDPADTDEVKVIGKVNEIPGDPATKKAKETREE